MPKNWSQRHRDDLTVGQRVADSTARTLGSWPFIIGQTVAVAAYFWFVRHDLPAATVLVAWLGVSLRNVAVYMADSNVRILPLLGGQDGHDWAFIFGQWGVLNRAESIAGVVSAIGWLTFTGALGLAVWAFVQPRLAAREAAERQAHLGTLPVREPRNRPPVA